MKQSSTGTWALGAFLIAAVIGVLAYFFALAPQFEAGAEARAAAEQARNDNDFLELQIATMQAKAAKESEWREEIALISLDLPPTPQGPQLIRLVTSTLEAYDLPVIEISLADPAIVAPTFEQPEAPAPAEPVAGAEGEEGEEPAAPEPSPSPSPEPVAEEAVEDEGPAAPGFENQFEGLVGIPLTVNTEGDLGQVMDLMKDLQTQGERFFTITGYTIKRAASSPETPGRPEMTESDVVLTLHGLFFSLIDEDRSFPLDEEGESPEHGIGDDLGDPFEPLPGTSDDAEV